MSTRPNIPLRLCRYFNKDSWADFAKGKIETSDAMRFNDPFECLPEWGPAMQKMAKQSLDMEFAFTAPNTPGYREFTKLVSPLRTQLVDEITHKVALELQSELGSAFKLICFSSKVDNLLMWGHYARSHTGFVVEFDPHHSMFTSAGRFRFGPVQYETARPVMPLRDRASVDKAIDAFFYCKTKEWEYEDEYRLVWGTKGLSIDATKHLPVDPAAIKAIYLGCRSNLSKQTLFWDFFTGAERKHIQVFQMEIDAREYKLNPVLVSPTPPAP